MNLRYLWRSVSLVFVLWFALFPTLSYASETVTNQTYTYDWREAEREMQEYIKGDSALYSVTPDDVANGLIQTSIHYFTKEPWTEKYSSVVSSWVSPMAIDVFEFSTSYASISSLNSSPYASGLSYAVFLETVDGSPIVDKSLGFNFVLNGLKSQVRNNYKEYCSYHQKSLQHDDYFPIDASQIDEIYVNMYDKNNTLHQVYFSVSDISDVLTINGDTFGIDTNLSAPDFDVVRMEVYFSFPLSAYNLVQNVPSGHVGHESIVKITGLNTFINTAVFDGVLKIDIEDVNTGLLKGIIEWLRNIVNGITAVKDNIVSLPSRIWTFIQEGLKMLFIPSEQDISNMHNQWDELMRDRFGAIYESGDIVHSFADTMNVNSAMVADTGGVITMPSVTANLAGTNFTFGGYEVDLVPDGFQWLVTSIKMLINIVCTILFINALKGKIEVLLR